MRASERCGRLRRRCRRSAASAARATAACSSGGCRARRARRRLDGLGARAPVPQEGHTLSSSPAALSAPTLTSPWQATKVANGAVPLCIPLVTAPTSARASAPSGTTWPIAAAAVRA